MNTILHMSFIFVFVLFVTSNLSAQSTEFTYQGTLQNASAPATGSFDFEFLLYDAVTGGTQIGATLTKSAVAVSDGSFMVKLDFGSSFPGSNRFLEIHVRTAGSGAYTPLAPRQAISSSPYSLQSLNATTASTAVNATQLGGLAAGQFVLTNDARLSDPRPPTAGSTNYVQNGSNQQTTSNFNISGTGSANILNARSQFNLNGDRILSNSGAENLFAGSGAGTVNILGDANSFFGHQSGFGNVNGHDNSFFGRTAGKANDIGSYNSFYGSNAGVTNTQGNSNSFFGSVAGRSNTSGSMNSYFGDSAGLNNLTGGENAFFGSSAGRLITGNQNTFIGSRAGWVVGLGTDNTALGYSAGMGTEDLMYATAIGAGAVVSTSNQIQLGRQSQDTVSIGKLASGGSTAVCLNGNTLSFCGSSLRYKNNIISFTPGLDLVKKLRPVSFSWRDGGMLDMGLVAEEVNKAEPLLTTTNTKGEVEGVKYDRVGVVLVNAVKEQQAQIEAQATEIERQRNEIAALKALVCIKNKKASFCRSAK